MTPIRVLLAVPPVVRDALRQGLAAADDIEIAYSVVDPVEILLAAGAWHTDVVVIVMEGDEVPGVATHLVAENPHMKVLGVTQKASRAALYELRPQLVHLGEISPAGIAETIRTAMSPDAAD